MKVSRKLRSFSEELFHLTALLSSLLLSYCHAVCPARANISPDRERPEIDLGLVVC